MKSFRSNQRGISLIEMMVGIAIGLVCVLIILQLLSAWEARKRTTTSGNDAQISGTLAGFTLDRDLRLAGYGFGVATSDVMGCNVVANRSGTDISFPLRPVEIVKTVGKPDEVHVLYGNSPYFVATQPMLASAAEAKTLKSRDGFQLGDRVVVTGNSPMICQLVEITAQALADTVTLEHKSGATYMPLSGIAKTATLNPAGGTGTTFTTGRVFDLGPAPVQSIWTVDTAKGSLMRYNRLTDLPTAAVEVASDVVTLKAQYGIDISGNGEIESTEWVDSTTASTNWTQVLAVRFGLLVRSRQYERPNTATGTPVPVTTDAPTWGNGQAFDMMNVDNSADAGSSPTAVNGAGADNNWRNYRYRVYESVVPLRNMIWGTAP
jgi:type IV pilus assembly protein PilW